MDFNVIGQILWDLIATHVIDWIITAIITFVSVKYATQKYYGKVRVVLTQTILEQGLRALLKLKYNETLPLNAAAIFVEYKGFCHKLKFKRKSREECTFGDKIRKTIAYAGGESMNISSKKLRDYGVLGVANNLKLPVIFDFQENKLYKYEFTEFMELAVSGNATTGYEYVASDGQTIEITRGVSGRDIMIAYPLIRDDKLVGGITFDMKVASNTIYKKILPTDNEALIKKKKEANIEVLNVVKRTADNVLESYFSKKGVK